MIRSRTGRLLVAAAAVLLAGCSSRDCTVAGCESVVTVDVTGDLGPTGLGTQPATLTLCVDTACQDSAWPMDEQLMPLLLAQIRPAPTSSRPVQVRLSARTADGADLFSSQLSVPLVRTQPNGEGCAPVCWSAALRLSAGTLVVA